MRATDAVNMIPRIVLTLLMFDAYAAYARVCMCRYTVRDVWGHVDMQGVIVNGHIKLSAAPHDSTFYTITPQEDA